MKDLEKEEEELMRKLEENNVHKNKKLNLDDWNKRMY